MTLKHDKQHQSSAGSEIKHRGRQGTWHNPISLSAMNPNRLVADRVTLRVGDVRLYLAPVGRRLAAIDDAGNQPRNAFTVPAAKCPPTANIVRGLPDSAQLAHVSPDCVSASGQTDDAIDAAIAAVCYVDHEMTSDVFAGPSESRVTHSVIWQSHLGHAVTERNRGTFISEGREVITSHLYTSTRRSETALPPINWLAIPAFKRGKLARLLAPPAPPSLPWLTDEAVDCHAAETKLRDVANCLDRIFASLRAFATNHTWFAVGRGKSRRVVDSFDFCHADYMG